MGPNGVLDWNITYLPTSVRGIWLFHYLVIVLWRRKVVAWDVAEWEDAQIAAELVSRACLQEQIRKGCPQSVSLHADNGNAARAAKMENWLKELGKLRFCSRPGLSNANPYSESVEPHRELKGRPTTPSTTPAVG